MDVHVALVKVIVGMLYDLWTRLDIELEMHVYTSAVNKSVTSRRKAMARSLRECHDAIVSLENLIRQEEPNRVPLESPDTGRGRYDRKKYGLKRKRSS